jgi:hypothetical protein
VFKSAKDYGFNEGYLLEKGAIAPAGHTTIGDVNDKEDLVVPNTLLDDEHNNFSAAFNGAPPVSRDPATFGQAYKAAKSILNGVGLDKVGSDNTIKVGVDFRGDAVYSNRELANDRTPDKAVTIVNETGAALGAMGAFADFKEAGRYFSNANQAADGNLHSKLDTLKAANDAKGFVSTLSKNQDRTGYAGYKLYENWGNMSQAQKAIGIAGVGMQDFTFDNGDTFKTKRLTPEIPGIPSMSAAEGLTLSGDGINVAPATKYWSQLSAIQETQFAPKKASQVVGTANSLGILGYDQDGRAVAMTRPAMAEAGLEPAPQFGVGAALSPADQGAPQGYSIVKQLGNKKVIVPTANVGTSHIDAPDVSSETSRKIYTKWYNPKGVKPPTQEKGAVGGSALIGGLFDMATRNPYALGAVMTYENYSNVSVPPELSDMAHVSSMAGITMQRLMNGVANKDIDTKGLATKVEGEFNEGNFSSAMKNTRAEYAKNGISSKEVGYQLANQAYAENRLNESQLVSAQQMLNMVFDDEGFNTAQKIVTGKNKGLEITNKRKVKEAAKNVASVAGALF